MLGESLQAEIEQFVRFEAEKPISEEYLNSIGRVELDERLSLLHDVKLIVDVAGASSAAPPLVFNAIFAGFGPLLRNSVVVGEGRLPQSAFMDETEPSATGCILLARRGKVSFVSKALRAQTADALALVVVQTYELWPFVMTDSASEEQGQLRTPVVMLSAKDGELLGRILQEASSARVTLKASELVVECAICQEALEAGQTALKLPDCGHVYHDQCVRSWLEKQHTCPLCRKAMPKKPAAGEKRAGAEDHRDIYYS